MCVEPCNKVKSLAKDLLITAYDMVDYNHNDKFTSSITRVIVMLEKEMGVCDGLANTKRPKTHNKNLLHRNQLLIDTSFRLGEVKSNKHLLSIKEELIDVLSRIELIIEKNEED